MSNFQIITRRALVARRHTAMGAMALTAVTALALLGGCATHYTDVSSMTPQQMAQKSDGIKINVADFIERPMRYASKGYEQKCGESHGQLRTRSNVVVFVPENKNAEVVYKSLPAEFVCSVDGKPAWGITVGVGTPTIRFGNLGVYYLGVYQAAYEAPETVVSRQLERDARARDRQDAHLECTPVGVTGETLAIAPLRLGSQTAVGTVIELKGPLALIQLIDAQRRVRQRDQEWLPTRELMTEMTCP